MAREFDNKLIEFDFEFSKAHDKEICAMSDDEKQLFNHLITDRYHYSYDIKYPVDIEKKQIKSLSNFFRHKYSKAIHLMVPAEFIDDFYYMLEKFNQFQYSQSYSRRSFRSPDYSPFVNRAFDLMYAYYLTRFRGTDINDMGKYVSERDNEFSSALRNSYTYDADSYIIAARIDKGDNNVINMIKEMITSENNTEILTPHVIRAVIRSDNEELHELMCKLLVAARLSEGLRQAICENADCGTAGAFKKLVKTIEENNLVRFSSIKRAIGTWTGLARYEDPDRLAEKILSDIPYVLESRENAVEYIKTSDAVHIYMGLWGLGFYDIGDALDVILNLAGCPEKYDKKDMRPELKALFAKSDGGAEFQASEIQLLTIGYFCIGLEYPDVTTLITLSVVENFPESYKLFSVYDSFYLYRNFDEKTSTSMIRDMHRDKALAAKHYEIMKNMCELMPKKKVVYEPMLFPWNSSGTSTSVMLSAMLDCACILDDDEKVDDICGRINEFDVNHRWNAVGIIGERRNTPRQREVLIRAAADRESYTRKTAIEIMEKIELEESDYEVLEGFAKYKTADLREGIIKLIKNRDADGLHTSIMRMLQSKDENIRLAALDLLLFGLSQYKDKDFAEAKSAASAIESPSDREQILINEIIGSAEKEAISAENGYGLYDPKTRLEPADFKPDVSVIRNFFNVTREEITEMHLGLMKLIDENADVEYKDDRGEERILGNFGALYHQWIHHDEDQTLRDLIPLTEIWDRFYQEVVKTPQRFIALKLEKHERNEQDLTPDARKLLQKNRKMLFGELADYNYAEELGKKDERFTNSEYYSMRRDIFFYIEKQFDIKFPLDVLQHLAAYIAKELSEEELWLERQKKEESRYYFWGDKRYCFRSTAIIQDMINELQGRINEDFETNFRILHELSVRIDKLRHYENGDIRYFSSGSEIPVEYYLKAYRLGIISKDTVLKTMFETFGIEDAIRNLNQFVELRQYNQYNTIIVNLLAEEGKKLNDDNTIPTDSRLYQNGNMFAQTILDKILDVELKRGDSETVFSGVIKRIDRIFGMDRLMEILKAIGNDTISRASYYYGNNMSKKDSLSHLLNVCYPAADDNAQKLAEYLKKSKIKNDRLIEVAMFAPQWIDIIQDYLQIDGMKSGCYYFMAHTADHIDNKREAIITKYTPLTKEELNGGCFDINWFREAYEILGEKMFDKLYKSAKYISSSNMHTRARKYADAALGKMDIAETEAAIEDKRNKDLLMSLAIIPSKNQEDILQRYEFIQKFLKESKQFGAQRRASEGSAAQFALKNLAVTAGYSDETRLTLSMETELVKGNQKYFSPNRIGEYDVVIEIDISGKAAMKFEKGGKILKSAPAAIKKNEEFIEIKGFCDKLRQQYSRTVKMLELAMEERDTFRFGELLMLCENPVTKAIVENLVFVSADGEWISGSIADGSIVDQNGEAHYPDNDFMLRVAHPYDLYKHQVWAQYQQRFLELGEKEGRKQPFRQIFRELYVKLSEELDKDKSLMFAGNQIQTMRTVGALKNRRWVADYEDGLQKVYYKDNIIAGIYAVADWFSPSDIEAPTLEGVTFADRKTYQSLKIGDIPDILYSEVMRDVDLAVSVAHAGGVDPETSHSTVEMRKVILAFNLKLFGIKNVTLEKNHALIDGKHGKYTIHLGSGVIHKTGGHQINVVSVSDGKKSKLFLPFIDEDPKTAEIMTKVLTFAQDDKIKDPYIMDQIKQI